MGKTVLDWLREMAHQQKTPQPPPQGCRRVSLPEFWQLPRRYGVAYGCVEEKDGIKYITVAFAAKGITGRYKLIAEEMEHIIRDLQRKERRKVRDSCIPQYFADTLFELSAKYEIVLMGCHTALVDGVEVSSYQCRSKIPESCVREIAEYIRREKPRIERVRMVEEMYNRLLRQLKAVCPHATGFLSSPWQLRDLWEREEKYAQLSTWCEAEAVLRRYNLDFVVGRLYNVEVENLREFAILKIGDTPCAVINGGAWCRGAKYYSVKREGGEIYLCRDDECLRAEILEPPSFSLYTHRLTAPCLYSTFCSKWRISATGRGSQVAA